MVKGASRKKSSVQPPKKTAHDLMVTILGCRIIGTDGVEWTKTNKKWVLALFDTMVFQEKNDEFHRGMHHQPSGWPSG